MIWSPLGYWRPMTKRERKLDDARRRERAREIRAAADAKHAAEIAKQRGSWDRMTADIARKYSSRVGRRLVPVADAPTLVCTTRGKGPRR